MARILFVALAEERLGIEYLSAALKKAGHETELALDLSLFPGRDLVSRTLAGVFGGSGEIVRKTRDFRPDIACFSVVTQDYRWALGAASTVKAVSPRTMTAFGGPHATAVPDRVIREKNVDVCCIGEGDAAIVQLADAVAAEKDHSEIANLWVKSESGISKNPCRPLIEDMDGLPSPDKDLYYRDYASMLPGYTIQASRGCPFTCSYCHNSRLSGLYGASARHLRRRSPGNVLSELVAARRRYGFDHIRFEDEVFSTDIAWLREFLPRYAREVGLSFDCSIHPKFAGPEVIALLKSAGCAVARMGVQSINENTRRDTLDRRHTNDEIKTILADCRKSGLFVVCDNIFGLPGDDERDLDAMARFYIENPPGHIMVFWLNYFPGTKITARAYSDGVISGDEMEMILDGDGGQHFGRGCFTYRAELAPYQWLMLMIPSLPKAVTAFFLENERFKLLPNLDQHLLSRINLMVNKIPFDLCPKRTLHRYQFGIRHGIRRFRGLSRR